MKSREKYLFCTQPAIAPISVSEPERLRQLHALQVLDRPADDALDALVELAADMFRVPIALISLVDKDHQYFKSAYGLSVQQTHRDHSFCAHALDIEEPLVIPDALKDERFRENPLVLGEPYIRFYAGAQLRASAGLTLGTLCLLGTDARISFSGEELFKLQKFALVATSLLKRHTASEDGTSSEPQIAGSK